MSVGIVAALAKEVCEQQRGGMGRTALMKFAYLMQTVKGCPLGYDFRIYNYGPYDSRVLEDLKVAEKIGAVRTTAYSHPNGIGYSIHPGDRAENLIEADPQAADFASEVSWVVENFGSRAASDLEMISTIIFVDRMFYKSGMRRGTEGITSKVEEIKPRLDARKIAAEVEKLRSDEMLQSI